VVEEEEVEKSESNSGSDNNTSTESSSSDEGSDGPSGDNKANMEMPPVLSLLEEVEVNIREGSEICLEEGKIPIVEEEFMIEPQ